MIFDALKMLAIDFIKHLKRVYLCAQYIKTEIIVRLIKFIYQKMLPLPAAASYQTIADQSFSLMMQNETQRIYAETVLIDNVCRNLAICAQADDVHERASELRQEFADFQFDTVLQNSVAQMEIPPEKRLYTETELTAKFSSRWLFAQM